MEPTGRRSGFRAAAPLKYGEIPGNTALPRPVGRRVSKYLESLGFASLCYGRLKRLAEDTESDVKH